MYDCMFCFVGDAAKVYSGSGSLFSYNLTNTPKISIILWVYFVRSGTICKNCQAARGNFLAFLTFFSEQLMNFASPH